MMGRIFLLGFLALASRAADGQPVAPSATYVREHSTVADGLPINTITSLVQTRDGYLWLGTNDGVVRFDGVRFTVYNAGNTAEIPSNRIVSLHEDRWRALDPHRTAASRAPPARAVHARQCRARVESRCGSPDRGRGRNNRTGDDARRRNRTEWAVLFDPGLGFATGGGSFVLGADKVNFGFTMKYGKNSTNLQGNFIAVRHYADGTVSRLKSNTLGGLALGEDANVPMGWATFNGKATYTKWDASAGAYVTVGNQSFAVYAEDRDNPGTGIDRIWLGGPSALAMAGTTATAKSNTAVLTGGGIAVPHRAGGKK